MTSNPVQPPSCERFTTCNGLSLRLTLAEGREWPMWAILKLFLVRNRDCERECDRKCDWLMEGHDCLISEACPNEN